MSDYYSEHDQQSLPLFSHVNRSCIIENTEAPDSEEYSQKKEEILKTLRAGDISCVDMELKWHRGQAVIGDLRKRGHIIHTIRGAYHYVGFRGDMVKAKVLQEAYYQSEHWRAKALQRKVFDNFRCTQCHATEELETHHWRYDLFNEKLRDLVTLCRQCHQDMHEMIKGSSVHFPAYVTQEMAKRIQQG